MSTSDLTYKNKLAIASISLGQHPSHTLPSKILAAAKDNFSGIEIVYSDLAHFCATQTPPLTLVQGAQTIKELCKTHNLIILSLAPFKNFEAHASLLATRLEAARHWLEIAQALGALYLQVPSQFETEHCINDEEVAVKDLQALADLAAEFGVKIAYEAVAWGTFISTWQEAWKIVKRVDKVNFGMCWDVFHVLARIWGSCTVPSGRIDGGDKALEESLREFVDVLKGEWKEKVYYVQLSDGEFFDPVLEEEHRFWSEGMDSRLMWSRNARPFPLEREMAAYFPIKEVVTLVLGEGEFEGWLSFEIFDWRMRDEGFSVEEAARRGWKSWVELNMIEA